MEYNITLRLCFLVFLEPHLIPSPSFPGGSGELLPRSDLHSDSRGQVEVVGVCFLQEKEAFSLMVNRWCGSFGGLGF